MPDVTRSTYRDRLLALVRDQLGHDAAARLETAEQEARERPEDPSAEARWLDAVGAAERDLILGGVPMEA